MNKINKLALLSLLAIAAFMPQQSQAVKLTVKQWLGLGTALTFGSVAAYQIYESISAHNKEIDEEIKENNEKMEQLQNKLTEEKLLENKRLTTELEEKVEKQKKENEENGEGIELKNQEPKESKDKTKEIENNNVEKKDDLLKESNKKENAKTIILDPKEVVYNSFYAGYNSNIANVFYNIPENSSDKILFEDKCYVVMGEKKTIIHSI